MRLGRPAPGTPYGRERLGPRAGTRDINNNNYNNNNHNAGCRVARGTKLAGRAACRDVACDEVHCGGRRVPTEDAHAALRAGSCCLSDRRARGAPDGEPPTPREFPLGRGRTPRQEDEARHLWGEGRILGGGHPRAARQRHSGGDSWAERAGGEGDRAEGRGRRYKDSKICTMTFFRVLQ